VLNLVSRVGLASSGWLHPRPIDYSWNGVLIEAVRLVLPDPDRIVATTVTFFMSWGKLMAGYANGSSRFARGLSGAWRHLSKGENVISIVLSMMHV
jgi:hypothetical protein